MSENGNTIVAFVAGLIVGVFFGAVFALLYAPEAGEEMRHKIQGGAQANWLKASHELDRVKHRKDPIQDETLTPQAEG